MKDNKKNQGIKKPLNVTILLLCLLLLLGIIFLLVWQSKPAVTTSGPLFDANAKTYYGAMELDTSSGGIKVPGYSEVYHDVDSSVLKLPLVNPETNTCYFQYTLSVEIDGAQSRLYQSGLIEPGMYVGDIPLPEPLPAGSYPLSISVSTFRHDDLAPLNGANVKATLYIA